jgi:hypothetical protein
MMSDPSCDIPDNIFFIFQHFKNFTKVTTIDSLTQIEVILSAPRSLSEEQMKELGLRKLIYVLKKHNKCNG